MKFTSCDPTLWKPIVPNSFPLGVNIIFNKFGIFLGFQSTGLYQAVCRAILMFCFVLLRFKTSPSNCFGGCCNAVLLFSSRNVLWAT